jgi:hypothetical protein
VEFLIARIDHRHFLARPSTSICGLTILEHRRSSALDAYGGVVR